jgi:hypothetical protein
LNYPSAEIVVRTPLDEATVMPSIKKVVYVGGSDQPVFDVHAMQEIVSESMSSKRSFLAAHFLGTASRPISCARQFRDAAFPVAPKQYKSLPVKQPLALGTAASCS